MHTQHNARHMGTPVNRSQVAQDTAHSAGHTEQAHRWPGAQWPRSPHTQHNTRHAGKPVNRSQVAEDTAHTAQHIEQAHR